MARHQRFGPVDHQVVVVEALLVALFDHVAEAFGGDEGGGRTLALDQGVGRKCRAVDEDVHVAGPEARLGEQAERPLEHRHFGCSGRGEQLAAPALRTLFQDNVGERPADVAASLRG